MLRDSDFVDIETLRRTLDASESSIRRDLEELQKQNFLKRVYGGAISLRRFS